MLLKDLIRITKGKLIQGDLKTKIKNFSTDTRTLKKGDVFIALKGENFDGHQFLNDAIKKGAKGVIVSKNFDFFKREKIFVLKTKDTIRALGEIASFYRDQTKAKVIGVTGSNGKTTTKEMIAQILKSKFRVLKAPYSFNNIVGVPLTLLNLKEKDKIVVLELGANHKKEIEKLSKISKPEIGVITNIGKAHIGYFGSQEKIFQAKKEILKSPKIKVLVLNNDDPFLRKIKFKRKITFGIKNKADFYGEILKEGPDFTLFKIKDLKIKLPLPGVFNVYNALASIAVSSLFKVPLKKAKRCLERYKSLPLRSEFVKIKRATIFDDCYNANPSSFVESLKVLENFSEKKIVVLGDMLELGKYSKREHQKIGKMINNIKPEIVIGIGKESKHALKEVKGVKKFWFLNPYPAIKILKPLLNEKVFIFIKGSRKMQLEKIVEGLKGEKIL
jgi:UDP-N-acetylmuramoyl-tripeptide--D-alanyl-D-alanine ligase